MKILVEAGARRDDAGDPDPLPGTVRRPERPPLPRDAPDGTGTAFVPYTGGRLDRILALRHDRVVGNDNCVAFEKRRLQLPPAPWRYSFAQGRFLVPPSAINAEAA